MAVWETCGPKCLPSTTCSKRTMPSVGQSQPLLWVRPSLPKRLPRHLWRKWTRCQQRPLLEICLAARAVLRLPERLPQLVVGVTLGTTLGISKVLVPPPAHLARQPPSAAVRQVEVSQHSVLTMMMDSEISVPALRTPLVFPVVATPQHRLLEAVAAVRNGLTSQAAVAMEAIRPPPLLEALLIPRHRYRCPRLQGQLQAPAASAVAAPRPSRTSTSTRTPLRQPTRAPAAEAIGRLFQLHRHRQNRLWVPVLQLPGRQRHSAPLPPPLRRHLLPPPGLHSTSTMQLQATPWRMLRSRIHWPPGQHRLRRRCRMMASLTSVPSRGRRLMPKLPRWQPGASPAQ
mmetsp:Transcript_143364/g.363908  ORF Transcript_143364/g.363908 Transcript_143364/m.363908 type:complete len:343 (+) Transcript_143364:496-1524(+)